MRRTARTVLVLAALVVFAFVAGGALAKPGGVPAIPMNTGQEVGVVNSDASGSFSYTIAGNQLCYTLEVRDMTQAPFAAHIHPGPRQVAGPVAVPLLTPPGATSTVSDCITAAEGSSVLTLAELAAIAADPGAFYVNVHTTTYPGGELRGQLK